MLFGFGLDEVCRGVDWEGWLSRERLRVELDCRLEAKGGIGAGLDCLGGMSKKEEA